ncbi:MAG: hypothetical protein CMG00_05840 [Candidatus Marinimicrobia bacterium]|nr:hypothetical protein [Candidatus Neomarinimicrobiota bacterium]|tara:strand:+ start:2705 stop:4462 length:1758 start_codon:yes stop_codon:yes gene_type:complete
MSNDNQYAEGLTIFSSFFDYYSAAIDKDGNEVWNSGNSNIVYYSNDGYGNLFGSKYVEENEYNLPGIQFSIDSEEIWIEPNDSFLHHDFFKLPNGNYMGLTEFRQSGQIPENIPFNILQTFSFFPTYPSCGGGSGCFVFPWAGDKIIEWESDTKNVVWEWSTFDYLDYLQDYDVIGGSWSINTLQDGVYDWTHCNALTYDSNNDKLYLSSRNLSRIIKIDKATKEIDWQIGFGMPSDEVDCGLDLNFSFQHSIQILENGNILIFDNGNISQLLDDSLDYPTSRALEINVEETDSGCNASIVWEYRLSEDLFGNVSGNTAKLNNGNYLITTIGEGGTSLEVNNLGEIVWRGNYNLTLPAGLVYRAHRIKGLYPVAFSVTANNYSYVDELGHVYPFETIDDGNGMISIETSARFKIWNNGDLEEVFEYQWFEENGNLGITSPVQSITISPGNYYEVTGIYAIGDEFSLRVTPRHRPELEKIISMTVVNSQTLSNETISLPSNYKLKTPYPNPFNPSVNIEYFAPSNSFIELKIYNMTGTLIKTLESKHIIAGNHSTIWNAKDIASGNYIVELNADNFKQTKKITLIK